MNDLNPVKELLGKLPFSILEFERRNGLSHSAVMQTIAGQFPAIPARVGHALLSELAKAGLPVPEADLDLAYANWKFAHRKAWAEGIEWWPEIKTRSKKSPFRCFVDEVSTGISGFSKGLAIPFSTVRGYYIGNIDKMPKAIASALTDVGYDPGPLAMAQRVWLRKEQARAA